MDYIAIFASGSGTNAERIMEHFRDHPSIRVALVLTNNPSAGVLERAGRFGVPAYVFDREQFTKTDEVLGVLKQYGVTMVVLAGFLWLVPANILRAYEGRILNIHPALLPRFGGKGMYGARVHEAVIAAGETESGITIHRVNERYDEGAIIFQGRCRVMEGDTPDTLAGRIHELEYRYYAEVIENAILSGRWREEKEVTG